jgi:lactate permease
MSVRWTYIDPHTVFNPFIGFQTVLIALIGGAVTLWGPLIAAVVFSLLAETLRLAAPQVYMMTLGLLLILSVLYLPGGLLILVCVITYFLHQMRISDFGRAIRDSGSTIIGAGFVLIFTVPMVRVMINSGVNAYELASMPIAMARGVADLMGQVYPLFAPAVGALGAFLAGSNTVSNLMLSQFQFETAGLLGLSGALMVAIQSVGAAAGNMIAIHNVVAASATVGLLGREGITLRITILPTLYYLILAGILGMLALHVVGVTDPLVGVLSGTPLPK